ncbi:hypothetical protein T440DRAFT_418611 [Plenodomus tracheiphilus IPT5]|uniref:Secretory phospholipase A2 n=1 Tax=Plenodomus tracheiphilus IPT5 TaxID=1408161 RepID=A0A6A7BDK0_9PLEO|nr:hypothetical protein T440DRAFT_418611 [Plenodomus tracheiphilus IPT5]
MLLSNIVVLACTGAVLAKDRDSKNYNKAKDMTEIAKSTDYLVFQISADTFQERRKNHDGAAGLDWSADGCNHAADRPFGWDFKNSCDRHDFAYRNYKKQGRFSSPNKKKIDQNFKKDMIEQCKHENGDKGACRTMARTYYHAVRVFARSLAGRIDTADFVDESDDEDWDEDEEAGAVADEESVKSIES